MRSIYLPSPLSRSQERGARLWTLLPLLLCLMVLLSSCSHTRPDGPPNFYVDETRIPNAVPKCEPRAKYGNYKSYVVLGKRYHTLPSSKNYNEVGTASWYGMKFHARRTSSGEPYSALGMTAAHKTLPLPTYVEVTNLSNHRRIIVKVNDRGPFESHRLIDLSYVAAKKLRMLGHGTAKVRVRAINIEEKPFMRAEPFFADSHRLRKPSIFLPKSPVYLQVGAFRNKTRAEKLRVQLANLFTTPVSIAHLNKLYRVKIGPLNDMTVAKQMTHRLQKLGFSSKTCRSP